MNILVSAIEPSANIHLASLLRHLEEPYTLSGIFDSSLGKPIADMQRESIMGFKDAIKRVPKFMKLAKEMVELSFQSDKVLLIDSSGFNLPLAKKIKKRNPNVEIIYYILPQAWAWRRRRVYKLAKYCDKLLSIIPFEKEIYPDYANIKYVGHPLLDQIKEYKSSINRDIKRVLFMPGSRKSEIKELMPTFYGVAEVLKRRGVELMLAVPPHLKDNLELYGDIEEFTLRFDSKSALKEADFAFICSGTATLESAITGTPFILTYRAKRLDYFIAKRIVKLNYIGLANIFFEKMKKEPMHPELIQEQVTIKALLNQFDNYNFDSFLKKSEDLRGYLRYGSAKNSAKELASFKL